MKHNLIHALPFATSPSPHIFSIISPYSEFYRLATMSVDNGALTQLYAATSPKLEGVSGRFYVPIALDRTESSNPHGHNVTLAKLLWEQSERIVG